MTALLGGVAMTMNGIAPSPERAAQLNKLLDRIAVGVGVTVEKVKSVLAVYSAGSAPARADLLEASAEWRAQVPVLRQAPQAAHEADTGNAPRG
ncbi:MULTISPECIES: hypothetical protein [unclassified Variovorax]|uniref:hypothetical protein n=1 Tax=unclassified Variovorax TaxID=663243 RepID=UPI0011AFAC7E|nr:MULTISPECIES: hypothetical protein [unclassified Variovorax]